jgi:cardiolipin synthase
MAVRLSSHRSTPDTSPAKAGHIRVYTEGDRLYDAMLRAVAGARHTVKLETYIFAYDEIGRRFVTALCERAAAGVQVLVHVDAVGSLFLGSHKMGRALRQGGVHLRWFHRWSWRDPLRYNRRNHRKLLTVDGKIGFLGGFNIHRQSSLAAYGEQRWRDTHLEVRGLLAHQLQTLFNAFWRRRQRRSPFLQTHDGEMLITNHSRHGRLFLRDLYAEKFTAAEKRIWITTPYFVPDRRTQRGLMRAALRGIEVLLLVPSKSNQHLANWAAHAAYANLLAAGVHIYEYLPRMLHAKTIVVDDVWSCVGTANMDYRSFFLNYELNLASTDRKLARTLERQFRHDLSESKRVQPRKWARRGWLLRILEFVGWAARRWL